MNPQSEYRMLCDYNGYNDCERAPMKMVNFACSPGLGCHQTRDAVDKDKGVYSNYGECMHACKKPISRTYDCVSFNILGEKESMCVPRKGSHGKFLSLDQCRAHCQK